ncbi:glucose 1-dehydrogenase [Shimazuella sp. AN120528]|uniref:SDR family NAD(P)-dependent oxidoreductase n=1 Tax=Shimazuella soli TaxID=1892854 RepID=UPI001F10F43A|nr:glucose 1-dehydrogenase [Shimazuella soli]MCH5584743.1 glucose 1-dehydrogenase [Shimazuella soli]
MSKLSGKTAIVTGASKGIGAQIAKELAAAGAAVVVNYSSSKEGADRVVADIIENEGQAISVQGNVANSADVKRMFEEASKVFGSIDVLVNNAGIYKFESIENVSEEEFHLSFNTNVLGSILMIQEALKYFPANGGSIINISSTASKNPVINSSIYSASKGAVDSLTVALSKELGARNIRVNAVAPGGTDTEGTQNLGIVGSDREKALAKVTPLGRFGKPQDIAPVVVFLASDDSAWLTGERITASGGFR